MVFNLIDTVVTQSFFRVFRKQFLEQIDQIVTDLHEETVTSVKLGFLKTIISKSQFLLGLSKGGYPRTIQQIRQPRHHQSTSIPCPFLRIISGAKYSDVPQIESAFYSFARIFDSPKSVNLIYPNLSRMTFSAFKLNRGIGYSLQMTLCW